MDPPIQTLLSFVVCISTELDRHIYRNQAPYRITFTLTQRRIYKISSNTDKKARLPATANIWEHEQASTRLNFASKSSKGKMLRAVKNFNGPFTTPPMHCKRLDLIIRVGKMAVPSHIGDVKIVSPISTFSLNTLTLK